MAPIQPEILWAQRSSDTEPERNVVFLTINAPELDPDYHLSVEGNQLTFRGKTHQVDNSRGTASTIEPKEYECTLTLFADATERSRALSGKSLQVVLQKRDAKQEYWPRLVADKGRNNRIRSNFDLWRDEDEQEDEDDDKADQFGGMGGAPGGGMPPGMGGMGDMGGMMGGMGGMGGAGGPGGMDFASMMQGMGGGAGGAGGAGGMDFEKMMEQLKASGMGGAGGAGFGGAEGDDEGEEGEDDDEGPPPLEEA
ncbi:uncharacterized protein RHOBADRAFT_42813 [Rhodotorula graminis WP1]|uniref:CS domain-containing protein n=1 Tax=Rhodotorula graminis (strain WP1) TaxID=578459 RepID=A0A194S6X3_RHOGW|nr:uncharacterized protein RHOBADRAFT_42813 [Rhodotorula graminis WP1]KPV76473.1 hypothetical protein RHOBADRAFT_42813 [Rhodotorula graminis WP1]